MSEWEDCVRCGNPLRTNESAYVAWVGGVHFWPLHRECFDVLSTLDGFSIDRPTDWTS